MIASPLLRAETAVVGTILQTVQSGAYWQNNMINAKSGWGLVIYPSCSSFHNVSLALLCWVTISRLASNSWHGRDYAIAGVIAAVMISMNMTRLLLMAVDKSLYHYWHDGAGSQIFVITASLFVLLASLFAVRRTETVDEGACRSYAIRTDFAGLILTNARPADPPADAEQMAAAVINVARSNNLIFRGRTTLANHLIDALTFDAKDCREPITVALLLLLAEQIPLLEMQDLEGRTLRFIFYGSTLANAQPGFDHLGTRETKDACCLRAYPLCAVAIYAGDRGGTRLQGCRRDRLAGCLGPALFG